jgi:DNA invertase Pin-like site-specific DNA recombinase
MAELTKIGPAHLRREAWVYVRQSTMTQVRENTESLKRQYELVERAHRLGWPADRVRVIDDDLGCSGAEATARVGFQGLVAAVGLGQVGLVLGIEVSRLARRNADWYHLLDLCAMTDTLIADADGLYHPGDYNDRLVLGLKGTMSEAELHVLRSRLDAGLRHKATRGELRQLLPVGLDYDEDGRIVVSPDEAVRAAIVAVFDRFDELGSARQVVLSLRADGLRLPRRSAGARLIRWAEATYPAVHDFLTNPAYGGAFVFGRTKVSRHLDEAGRIVTRERELPLEEWEVTIPDHHPGTCPGRPIWPTENGCAPTHMRLAGKMAGVFSAFIKAPIVMSSSAATKAREFSSGGPLVVSMRGRGWRSVVRFPWCLRRRRVAAPKCCERARRVPASASGCTG